MSELITTPFDRKSTALDVIDGIDLNGRRAIVTGASCAPIRGFVVDRAMGTTDGVTTFSWV